MNNSTQQLQEPACPAVDLKVGPKPGERGWHLTREGRKTWEGKRKHRQSGTRTVKKALPPQRIEEYAAIYTLHLSGMLPLVISKKTGVSSTTVRMVIRKGDQALNSENRSFLTGIVRACFLKAVNHHNTLADEYGIQFVQTQLARNKLEFTDPERQSLEGRLRVIGRELISTNKAFVEMLCRMGVPHAPPTTIEGSHTDGSGDNNFDNSVYSKLSIEDAEILAIETVEKQLVYLKGQKKKREKEAKDD